jgi:hypothetical protein
MIHWIHWVITSWIISRSQIPGILPLVRHLESYWQWLTSYPYLWINGCGTLIFTAKSLVGGYSVYSSSPYFCGSSLCFGSASLNCLQRLVIVHGHLRTAKGNPNGKMWWILHVHVHAQICIHMYYIYIYRYSYMHRPTKNCSGLCTPKNGEIYKTNNMRYSKLQSCG